MTVGTYINCHKIDPKLIGELDKSERNEMLKELKHKYSIHQLTNNVRPHESKAPYIEEVFLKYGLEVSDHYD